MRPCPLYFQPGLNHCVCCDKFLLPWHHLLAEVLDEFGHKHVLKLHLWNENVFSPHDKHLNIHWPLLQVISVFWCTMNNGDTSWYEKLRTTWLSSRVSMSSSSDAIIAVPVVWWRSYWNSTLDQVALISCKTFSIPISFLALSTMLFTYMIYLCI